MALAGYVSVIVAIPRALTGTTYGLAGICVVDVRNGV